LDITTSRFQEEKNLIKNKIKKENSSIKNHQNFIRYINGFSFHISVDTVTACP